MLCSIYSLNNIIYSIGPFYVRGMSVGNYALLTLLVV